MKTLLLCVSLKKDNGSLELKQVVEAGPTEAGSSYQL